MQQLTGLDSSFLYLETATTPMHVGSLNVYEGRLTFDDFRDFLSERLHLAPRLLQKLVTVPMGLGNPYWIDDADFDINLHIQHLALPKPGDWKALRQLTSKMISQPLDRSRPLWEFIFVEGLDNIPQVKKGSVAIISKIHHAAIDGASGAEIMGLLFDVSKKPRNIPPAKPKAIEQAPSNLSLLGKSYVNLIKSPFKLPSLLLQTAKTTLATGKISRIENSEVPRTVFNAPRTRLNQSISSRRLWNSALLSLERVKALRTAVEGSTLNDVVLAICTGALRRYLLEKDELPKKPLVAMVPVNTRSKSAGKDMGNQVSAMLIQLPTHLDNPIDQLRQLHKNTQRGKAYQNAIGAKQMTDYAEFIPFALGAGASRLYTRMRVNEYHRPLFNLVITNVPGPQVPLYMDGKLLLANMGFAPVFDGMGLIIPVLSYNGVLSFSPTTAANVMPDVDKFTRYLRESANTLEQYMQNPDNEEE
jgi:WS/DGAT/MGAT family acyltransferase